MNLNTPNKLIIFRFILTFIIIIILSFVPLSLTNNFSFSIGSDIYVSWLNVIALILFIIASFTDYLDGYLARKNNQITNFGKFFDPLADKVLINSVLVFFAAFEYIPIWIVVIFIIRDIMVDGLRMNLSTKGKVLSADKFGKLKTFFQMIGIIVLFIIHSQPTSNYWGYNYDSYYAFSLIPILIALYFSIYSGIKYYYNNIQELF
ncbi:CDP-diacylglycerol--glycerol-3-phosphate 3-phosphatidyltransferase [Candidatus Hepatoplasma crinochetorum]|uniref:CDP-diacylglycerol--glycerol-3-phosphate 3-phosphatidyltransferase n=1 Tax=Candidatus Hepatoplasma crinochetorum TaxID=295596 RepID=UPI003088F6A5|nr:MAG: CDP-diacylglycerol--glycerol-3-phosphate 3-phosphatidyltransferase [Candidatus Hepatoplasma crinochetorum]